MSKFNKNETCVSASAWIEWQKQCTIGKCSLSVTDELASFGRLRLSSGLQKFDSGLASEYCSSESNPSCAWCMMEEHLYAGRNKQKTEKDGKRYKDMLFDSAKSPQEIEKYLTRVFQREVTRKIVVSDSTGDKRNADGRVKKNIKIVSLDAPMGTSNYTLRETLVNDNICNPSIENDDCSILVEPQMLSDDEAIVRNAEQLTLELWNSWSERTRIIFVLQTHELTKADIMRSGLINCAQSQLYATASKIKKSIDNIDWGMQLKKQQRLFLRRPIVIKLYDISEKWLERSEKKEDIYSVIMKTQSTKGS